MGTENACTVFYEDPSFAHEMLDFVTEFTIQVMMRALSEVQLDYFLWWEDFAFKTGPLVSPRIFREFLLPRYRRVNDVLKAHGVDVIFLDSDGNPGVLIPLLLEAGVNGSYPLEAAAGMDPVGLRRQYGHDLLLWGGVDKRALARDKQAIEKELRGKLPVLLEDGGYIPQLDHMAPPGIPYENWLFYLGLKRRMLEGR
jgi:uroporphyrinogen decarboxylase